MNLPEDTKVCNCASCGQLLIGLKSRRFWILNRKHEDCPPLVAGHMLGRPYCNSCLDVKPEKSLKASKEGINPGQENGIQALEDDLREQNGLAG